MHRAVVCHFSVFFFLMILQQPKSTLFPYTTLFRSKALVEFTNRMLHADRANSSLDGGDCSETLWRHRTPRELRSEEHTSELQSHSDLVCRLLLEKKNEQSIRHWLWTNQRCKQQRCR